MAMKSALSEYYNKGETNVKDNDPKLEFKNLPSNTIVVRVKHGSKIRNLMMFVEKSFKGDENKFMIFTGCGDAIEKTITCVEITKTKFKGLHQITKLSTLRVEEFWDPTKPDLDRLQVTREIPMVSILLSKEVLDCSEPGYQSPVQILAKAKKTFKRKKTISASAMEQSTSKEVQPPVYYL